MSTRIEIDKHARDLDGLVGVVDLIHMATHQHMPVSVYYDAHADWLTGCCMTRKEALKHSGIEPRLTHICTTYVPMTAQQLADRVDTVMTGHADDESVYPTLHISHDDDTDHTLAHITLDLGICNRMKDIDIALDFALTDPDLLNKVKNHASF